MIIATDLNEVFPKDIHKGNDDEEKHIFIFWAFTQNPR